MPVSPVGAAAIPAPLDRVAASPAAPTSTLAVRAVEVTRTAAGTRVSAEVGDAAVWFESADAPLAPVAEAWGSAFLIPALARGARLALPMRTDPTWLANIMELLPVLHEWWAYPIIPPLAEPGPPSVADPAVQSRTALCFSGGVDSFHSLLRGAVPVDALLLVHGVDIPLSDTARAADAETSLREVARARGMRAILVRTNLREHPVFAAAPWVHAHGGALAAVGHLLSEQIGRLLVSSSYPYVNDRPWGSHWRTDPLWSSGRLALAHLGAELWRDEKVRAIADDPLVRQHLRVCWENRARAGNCSRCDKCVTTMLMLEVCGGLAGSATFEPAAPLARLVDGLPHTIWVKHYDRLLAAGLERDTARAVRRLLRRSTPPTRLGRLRAGLRRRLFGRRPGTTTPRA